MTTAPEVVFKPVDGVHVYVDAPVAVKVTGAPEHTAASGGVTEIIVALTTTLAVSVTEIVPLVAVTV